VSSFDAHELDRLVDDLTALGLAYDTDFYVTGIDRGGPGLMSSEFYALTWDRDEDRFRVWYRDMGVKTELLRTSDFGQARARLMQEAIVLAGGRGRGPRARPH